VTVNPTAECLRADCNILVDLKKVSEFVKSIIFVKRKIRLRRVCGR
jgi:hypothetical protein